MTDKPDLARRGLLLRLGLVAGAVYAAPTVLHLDAAFAGSSGASGASGGKGSRGGASGGKASRGSSGRSRGGNGRGRASRPGSRSARGASRPGGWSSSRQSTRSLRAAEVSRPSR